MAKPVMQAACITHGAKGQMAPKSVVVDPAVTWGDDRPPRRAALTQHSDILKFLTIS